jgi:uncharacterized protein (TIGR02231 family)
MNPSNQTQIPAAMWRRRAALLLIPVMMAAAIPVEAAAVEASGARITRVTVYADRAEVVRQATVQLPAGAATVVFSGLPWSTESDSLRVSARGVPATLGAVELTQDAREPEETPELVAARAEVRRLEREIASVDAEEATAGELREFITSLKATTAVRESERLGEGSADPVSIQAVYDLVRAGLQDLAKGSLDRQHRRRDLMKELEVARARLAAARPSGPIRSRIASVEVEAEQPGTLTLDLEYVSRGASWRPSYRAALDAATGQVDLASEAVVRQTTGEDWSGVALRLSTAAPARGVQPPEMPPLLLRPVEPVALGRIGGVMMEGKAAAKKESYRVQAAREAGLALAEPEMDLEDAVQQVAGIVKSAYNVAFEVPGSSEVPADGRDHRVGLRQDSLPGSVRYRAVPAMNEGAFLVAKTKAPAGYPLLAGPVRVFAGGSFLGSFPLSETGPGAEVTLPFGIDNRIQVERTPLPQDRRERGIVGKDRVISYAFRTTVENLRDKEVTVTLEDRIPVSEDERIRVEMEKGTTAGHRALEDRPGILEWDLELQPREKREIILEYTIRFPKDLIIPGI